MLCLWWGVEQGTEWVDDSLPSKRQKSEEWQEAHFSIQIQDQKASVRGVGDQQHIN